MLRVDRATARSVGGARDEVRERIQGLPAAQREAVERWIGGAPAPPIELVSNGQSAEVNGIRCRLLDARQSGARLGDGVGDIIAALKLNGSLGATKYGLFAADEADAVGRSFAAMRLVRDFDSQNLGLMATHVDRPYLDREATVVGIDHDWRPTERWNVGTRLIGSDVAEGSETARDGGASVWADYEMDGGWRQQWIAMHFGNELDINDAGYLQRNSVNYLHWQVSRRFTDLPAGSRYASKDWRGRVSTLQRPRPTDGAPAPPEPRQPAA